MRTVVNAALGFRLFALVAGLVAGSAVGLIVGAARWRSPAVATFEPQRQLVLNRAKDAPAGGVVVYGDSIVERQIFSTMCGIPAFNAAIGSARAGDLLPVAAQLHEKVQPRKLVVAIGANDFNSYQPTPLHQFHSTVLKLVGGRFPVTFVGIASESDEFSKGVEEANALLRAIAWERGASYVPPIEAKYTEDGLHLNAEGLYEWKRRVNSACS